MGLLTSLVTGGPISADVGTPSAVDDFWYSDGQGYVRSASGMAVTPSAALKLSAFFRGVDLIARALAAVPWVLQRQLDNEEGEERDRTHPKARLLRRPNLWQTSAEFRYMGQRRVVLQGDFFARRDVVRGDEVLTPLHTTRMDVKLLSSGRRGYLYTPETGPKEPYVQDEIFHVMGVPNADGSRGVSVINFARDALGRSLAQQEWAARFFSQNGTPPYAFSHPQELSPTSRENLEKSIQSRVAGADRWHKAFVLEEGMKVERLGLSLRDSQFIELDQFGVVDVCRWLGVQPHKVYELSRATFSNIEHQGIEFLTDTMDPWYVFWEQAGDRDLLDGAEDIHTKFVREALLRGDLLSRAQAYAQFIQNGVMAENEAREREGLRKMPGLDQPTRSSNQGRDDGQRRAAGLPTNGRPVNTPQPANTDEEQEAEDALWRAQQVALAAATSTVRAEVAGLRTALRRGPEQLAERVTTFYGKHLAVLSDRLALADAAARAYCAAHCAAVLADATALERWEADAPMQLAQLALATKEG